MAVVKNVLTLVFVLLFVLLLQYYVTHREIVYYMVDKDSTNDDSKINPKSDPNSVYVATQVDDSISPITPESEILFPYPNITHLPHEILNSLWAFKMKAKLEASRKDKQLTVVMVSINYLSVLINWLVYAKLNAMPLLGNLLVVCVDQYTHEILSRKGILSQFVNVTDIIYSKEDMHDNELFSIITRLTILRLLNYWGYDVLQMDIDAILINNIEPILDQFHDSDIIISTANAKNCQTAAAFKAWSFCLCIGVTLIRSNVNTGMCTIAFIKHYVLNTSLIFELHYADDS